MCPRVVKSIGTRRSPMRWSKEEDLLLREAVELYGTESWTKIARHVGTKDHNSAYQHWRRVANPALLKDPFTQEEELKLAMAIREVGGKKWTKIASIMRSRSDTQCRAKWMSICRKTARYFKTLKKIAEEGEVENIKELENILGQRGKGEHAGEERDGERRGERRGETVGEKDGEKERWLVKESDKDMERGQPLHIPSRCGYLMEFRLSSTGGMKEVNGEEQCEIDALYSDKDLCSPQGHGCGFVSCNGRPAMGLPCLTVNDVYSLQLDGFQPIVSLGMDGGHAGWVRSDAMGQLVVTPTLLPPVTELSFITHPRRQSQDTT